MIINSSGLFRFKEPFEQYNSTKVLKVLSVTDIVEMIDNNAKPYDRIYKPFGLSREEFIDDLQDSTKIVTFQDTSKNYIYIPEKYVINQIGINTGVKYQSKGLAINIGALKFDYNLNELVNLIEELIKSKLGITPGIEIINTSQPSLIPSDITEEFELKRKMKSNDSCNYFNQLAEAKKIIKEQESYIKELKCYICDS